jgi:hypothetical protein
MVLQAVKINYKYQPLYTAPTRYFYLEGGRGGAKSFTVADYILRLTYEVGHKIIYTRYTLTSAEKSVIPEYNQQIEDKNLSADFYITKESIVNKKTGSEVMFMGIKTSSGNQTAKMKSIQGITTLVYDEFEEHPDEESFDKIDQSIRKKGVQNRIIMISNALHKQSWQYKRFFESEHPNTTYIYTTYEDNRENLSQDWLDIAESTKVTNITKYNKDYLGLHYDDVNGALWTMELINRNRANKPEEFKRIGVAIDPSTTAKETSDETGIIVGGLGYDNKTYFWEDRTGIYTPNGWARQALLGYQENKANFIVAEANQGGDMIDAVIKGLDPTVPVKKVWASRGKVARAEPCVASFEQGKSKICGRLPKLEAEMTTWNAMEGEISPGRIDAMVWLWTELNSANNNNNW